MSKRKNKSRLTKTDINTICEMQRKVNAYESYILGLCGLIQRKNDYTDYIILLQDTPMDDWVNQAFKDLIEMKKELNELRVKDIEKNILKTCE